MKLPHKTIYVRAEDEATFERAKELSGQSISSLILDLLRDYVEAKEEEGNG